jgi:16S rRNA (adenine1518-N6/adenine1519-N6)-dimethyltransferase
MLASAEQLFRVPPGAFSPQPRVESAVVRLTPLAQPQLSAAEEKPFRSLVTAAFGLRRKQMRRVVRMIWDLSPYEADALLSSAEIIPERRPETLSPQEFAKLLRSRAASEAA